MNFDIGTYAYVYICLVAFSNQKKDDGNLTFGTRNVLENTRNLIIHFFEKKQNLGAATFKTAVSQLFQHKSSVALVTLKP